MDNDCFGELKPLAEQLVQEALAEAGVDTFRELRHIWRREELGLSVKDTPSDATVFSDSTSEDGQTAGVVNPWFLLGTKDDDDNDIVQHEYEDWVLRMIEEEIEFRSEIQQDPEFGRDLPI